MKQGTGFPPGPRVLRIGPVEVYCGSKHFGVRCPHVHLIAVGSWVWLKRGWWRVQRVGGCVVARVGPFVLTLWGEKSL